MKKLVSAIFAAAGMTMLAFVSGCASNSNESPYVTMTPDLKGDIAINSITFSRNADNFMTCQLILRNTTSSPIALEWKAQWYDGQGIECDNIGTAWRRSSIQPNENKGISNTALSRDAQKIQVYIKKME